MPHQFSKVEIPEKGMALSTQLHVDQPQPSRLKESLDEAFTLVQALRQILETHQLQVDHAAMELSACKPVTPKDASTQTEEASDGMLREPPPGPSSPLATVCVNTRWQMAATPGLANSSTSLCFGIVDAAVQQACRTLLTPQTASKAGATHLGALLSLQSTPAPASAATTPVAAGRKSRLLHHKAAIADDASQTEFSPVPFAAYQHAHMQSVQPTAMAPPAAPTREAFLLEGGSTSGTTNPTAITTTDSAPGEQPRGMNDGPQHSGLPPPPPPDAASEPTGLSFTPNTTAVRLRAAMRWMQLQLQTSPSRVPRQRRYSDSSVSPALKILAPPGADGGQHAVAQPAVGLDAPAAVTADNAPVVAAAAAALPTHPPQYARPSGQRPEEHFSRRGPAAAAAVAVAAAAEPSVSASGVSTSTSGTGSQCEEAWQPDWPQPLVWYAAAASSAVAAPEPGGTVAEVGRPVTGQVQQPRAASTDPWVGGTGGSVYGPLQDISGSIVSNAWRKPQPSQGSEGNKQGGTRVGQHAKERKEDAAAKSGAAVQPRRGSGLRFGLRW